MFYCRQCGVVAQGVGKRREHKGRKKVCGQVWFQFPNYARVHKDLCHSSISQHILPDVELNNFLIWKLNNQQECQLAVHSSSFIQGRIHISKKDIFLLLSESHFLLCAKESAEGLSVKTKTHRFKNIVYTWPCHSPQSATELREKGIASVEDIGEKVLSSSPVCVNRQERCISSAILNASHPHTHVHTQTSAETYNATCCSACFARSFRTCQE